MRDEADINRIKVHMNAGNGTAAAGHCMYDVFLPIASEMSLR